MSNYGFSIGPAEFWMLMNDEAAHRVPKIWRDLSSDDWEEHFAEWVKRKTAETIDRDRKGLNSVDADECWASLKKSTAEAMARYDLDPSVSNGAALLSLWVDKKILEAKFRERLGLSGNDTVEVFAQWLKEIIEARHRRLNSIAALSAADSAADRLESFRRLLEEKRAEAKVRDGLDTRGNDARVAWVNARGLVPEMRTLLDQDLHDQDDKVGRGSDQEEVGLATPEETLGDYEILSTKESPERHKEFLERLNQALEVSPAVNDKDATDDSSKWDGVIAFSPIEVVHEEMNERPAAVEKVLQRWKADKELQASTALNAGLAEKLAILAVDALKGTSQGDVVERVVDPATGLELPIPAVPMKYEDRPRNHFGRRPTIEDWMNGEFWGPYKRRKLISGGELKSIDKSAYNALYGRAKAISDQSGEPFDVVRSRYFLENGVLTDDVMKNPPEALREQVELIRKSQAVRQWRKASITK